MMPSLSAWRMMLRARTSTLAVDPPSDSARSAVVRLTASVYFSERRGRWPQMG